MPTDPDLANVEGVAVERFAKVSARLAHAFAERVAVLRDEQLDTAGWAKEEAHWAQRFLEPGGDMLARRFADIFEATRRALFETSTAAGARDGEPSRTLRFLTAEAQPWRGEATAIGLESGVTAPPLAAVTPELPGLLGLGPAPSSARATNPLAATAGADGLAGRAALPFASLLEPPGAWLPPSQPRPAPNPLSATIDPPALPAAAVLPFAGSISVLAQPAPDGSAATSSPPSGHPAAAPSPVPPPSSNPARKA
jgi:hypothetical protein